jgi:hypothetical protein
MHTPNVTEISALSAHRREVALVRWSLVAVPAQRHESAHSADPLRALEPGFQLSDRFLTSW